MSDLVSDIQDLLRNLGQTNKIKLKIRGKNQNNGTTSFLFHKLSPGENNIFHVGAGNSCLVFKMCLEVWARELPQMYLWGRKAPETYLAKGCASGCSTDEEHTV